MLNRRILAKLAPSLCGVVLVVMCLSGCSSPPAVTHTAPAEHVPVVVEEERYAAIDRHALAAPAELKNDLPGLADYLVQPTRNEAEKARAVFRWITHNIAYDADNYFKGQLPQLTANEALARGVAVCYGYSNLFESLAQFAGLEAVTIRGKTKGYSYVVKGTPGLIAHAWNAVRVDGHWYLLDTAWGAGYLDGSTKTFVRRFQEHYFLTSPEVFIFDHFPHDQRWQLVSRPLSESRFNQLAYLRPGFFAAGLRLLSHQQGGITSRDNPLKIQVFVPKDNYISARLIKGKEKLPRESIQLEREGEIYTLTTQFPASGNDYRIRIYAKQGLQSREFDWALDYKVTVE